MKIHNSNVFILVTSGEVSVVGATWTPGAVYYLDANGTLTPTYPTTIGYYRVRVLVATSATTGIVQIADKVVISSTAGDATVALPTASTLILNTNSLNNFTIQASVYNNIPETREGFMLRGVKSGLNADWSMDVQAYGVEDSLATFSLASNGDLTCALPAGNAASTCVYRIL